MTTYYAHSVPGLDPSRWHLLKDHLEATGRLAAQFAAAFGAAELGRVGGLLHDVGKYSDPMQQRLRGAPVAVDHSTAGAREAVRLYGDAFGRILAYVIAGHHAGLPDFGSRADEGSLAARLAKAIPDYSAYRNEVGALLPAAFRGKLPVKANPLAPGFSLQFFIRMLFSCLVDADFLDTEAAVTPEQAAVRKAGASLPELRDRLETYVQAVFGSTERTPINRRRAEILAACRRAASQPPGLYTLTVPTGGGKTLSSLAFALHHAAAHGLRRVIYVIPFTSIIEQNAAVFRRAVGHENVLEHHSNFSFPAEDDESPVDYRLRLAQENWDAPIVVTTNVQFFESLFAHKPGRCRKLHNITRSVIILDEAQMIPTPYLKPCLWALHELVENYGATVVLCTATQPSIGRLLPKDVSVREIAPEPRRLYAAFRRVRVLWLGDMDDERLAQAVASHRQALCIVNTRSHAAQLYERLRGEGAYHLSARMYPAHRSEKLARIRTALAGGEPCRVVSTQLVEAGVDVDFPVVYRAIAGVDSIAQAAGRCNREGRLAEGQVFVFRPEPKHLPKGWFQRTATVTGMVLRAHADLLSLEAVDAYFRLLYEFENLDEHDIIGRFEEGASQLAFPFREVGETFRIIDSALDPVVIPRDEECAALLAEARRHGPSLHLSRRLQRFVVQVYPHELAELRRLGAVEWVAEQYTVLRDLSLYDDDVGLRLPDLQWTPESFVI
ncbi:MAG: CRISPR-associated helicase Cas3' [Limnochordales bacterium]